MQLSFFFQLVRTATLSTLVFLHSFWIPKLYLIPKLDSVFGTCSIVAFNLTVSAVYMGFAFLAHHRPKTLARPGITQFAVLAVATGSALFMSNLDEKSVMLLLAGSILYILGSYWINLFAHVSLAHSDKIPYLIGMAAAFPLARFTVIFISSWGFQIGMALGAAIPIAVYFLSAEKGRAILGEYLATPSPYDLSITNPSSFLPAANRFFVVLFLFNFVYASMPNTEADAAQYPFPFLTLIVPLLVIGYFLIRKNSPSANFLFQSASLFIVAAVLTFLAFPNSYALVKYDLSACGISLIELALYWYAVILLGLRNPLSILPTLTQGRAALSLGMLLGTTATIPFGTLQAHIATSAVAAFLFIGFNLIGLKNFDFDAMASRTTMPYVTKQNELDPPDAPNALNLSLKNSLTADFGLTPREVEVFELLAKGRSYRYIENALVLSRNTVKTHIRRIYQKLDIHSQQELIDFYETNKRA